jgi:hypothetical protein
MLEDRFLPARQFLEFYPSRIPTPPHPALLQVNNDYR